ncbi:MAG: UDP-N-acetylmuramoyl-tripeptide--D-alanyl-D-alanine ligase [Chitinophagaceae bacterium]|nr:MAG: UDP-N-acetylmuramoyl-tripeptide--D-alanyl-D-alanine ligase [Chitinophagaceae bacterium]
MTEEKLHKLFKIFLKSGGINTDSRKLKAGEIFVGIKGDNFDGNDFIETALSTGASAVITDKKKFELTTDDRIFYTENSIRALGQLAGLYRNKSKWIIIGITGSNGKTTTKELCQKVLSIKYKTFSTPGNFNNEIGMPLSILNFPPDMEIGILELGARFKGDVDYLSKIANPDHAIITNFGKDHLETFKNVENIIEANTEVIPYVAAKKGCLFLNGDDPKMQKLNSENANIRFHGSSETSTVKGNIIENKTPELSLRFFEAGNEFIINSKLTGSYNFYNFMTAVNLGLFFNIPPTDIAIALSSYEAKANRSQILKKDTNTFILDAYNANPDSMHAALDNLQSIRSNDKWAIVGDMLELGKYTEQEHLQIIQKLEKMDLEKTIFVGEIFFNLLPAEAFKFKTVAELKSWWEKNEIKDKLILLKASRGIALEKLIE